MARRAKKQEGPLSEAELMVLLKERYAAPEYAFLPHVRNGTGYLRRTTRTADALAMSLWPSRGLELHGFEIKSDRRDWLSEKANPEKAEEIARFCDRWWLVAGAPDIVLPGELPAPWGLLVAKNGKLVQVADGLPLPAKPMDRVQLAAILRRAAECVVPKEQIKAELDREYERGKEAGKQDSAFSGQHAARELKSLRESVQAFQKASGIELGPWDGGHIGAAVKVVLAGNAGFEERRLRHMLETAQDISQRLSVALEAVPPKKTGTEG